MSRYLTPTKVTLLALITLYTESVVPFAATIPVLSFLARHLLPAPGKPSRQGSAASEFGFAISIDAFQQATIIHASGIPGRTLWDLLLNKLWDINCYDALHVFFDDLSNLLESARDGHNSGEDNLVKPGEIRLSRVSPLGAFVRRCRLEFTRLQFHDGVSLWRNFISYRNPTLAAWKRRHQGVGNPVDINIEQDVNSSTLPLVDIVYRGPTAKGHEGSNVSTEDLEKLLEFQVDQMQSEPLVHSAVPCKSADRASGIGNRLPQEMGSYLRYMMESGVTVPSLSHYVAYVYVALLELHFLHPTSFLDAWKAGDYPSSFDSLHRYFDYTMHHRDRTFYQYALLNMAILQADFGCFSEAIVAMQEAISTARENDDMGCLNYCLSWLYHFGKEHPGEMGEVHRSGVLGTEREAWLSSKPRLKK